MRERTQCPDGAPAGCGADRRGRRDRSAIHTPRAWPVCVGPSSCGVAGCCSHMSL